MRLFSFSRLDSYTNLYLRIFVACLAVLTLSACGWSNSWNQKLTVEVETPDGLVTGSSITAVKWRDNKIFKDGASKIHKLNGEAVVVDLGKGRYLFALLKAGPQANAESIADLALQVVMGKSGRQWSPEAFDRVSKMTNIAIVPEELYPALVTFTDIKNPESIEVVQPANFEVYFGAGYRIRSLTLEITDEPITKGVVARALNWFNDVDSIIPVNKIPRLERDGLPKHFIGKLDFVSGNLRSK